MEHVVTLEWKDPEPSHFGRRRNEWDPGQWAVVARDIGPTAAANVRLGVYAALRPAGAFEATMRDIHARESDGVRVGTLYARYVGDEAT